MKWADLMPVKVRNRRKVLTPSVLKINPIFFDVSIVVFNPHTNERRVFRSVTYKGGKLSGRRAIQVLNCNNAFQSFGFVDSFTGKISVWSKYKNLYCPTVFERYARFLEKIDKFVLNGKIVVELFDDRFYS